VSESISAGNMNTIFIPIAYHFVNEAVNKAVAFSACANSHSCAHYCSFFDLV
jgi:hypothetical protein